MLEFGLQTYFCAIKLSAKLVFLGNRILVIPFFDIGKWLFVLTLKSPLNNVLESCLLFAIEELCEKIVIVRVRKSVFTSVIYQRETWNLVTD